MEQLELDPAKEIIRKSRTMKNVKLTEMLARLPGSKETFLLSLPSHKEIRYVPNLPLLCLLTSFPGVRVDASFLYCQGQRPPGALQDRTTTLLPT